MKITNFREYIDLPEYKREEVQEFINKVEYFAKHILPHMDEKMKAVLDITTLVGRGITATLCIYGYNEIYDDQFDFERVNTEQSMEKQVGGIVRSSIGPYDYISAGTFWTAKKRFGKGRRIIEIGPYVEIEFNESSIVKTVKESKLLSIKDVVNRVLNGENVRSAIFESASDVKVVKVDCEYTGGGITVYFGKLSNGQYFVFSNGTIMFCDSDYAEVFTPEFFEKTDGDTTEWESEHKIEEYFSADRVPENKKDFIKGIIADSFNKLGKPVDSDFVSYVVRE